MYLKQTTCPRCQTAHMQPWGKSQAQPWDTFQLRREDPESLLTGHPWLPDFTSTPTGHSSTTTFSDHNGYVCHEILRFWISPIPAGTIIDSGRYLVLSIPTIKHDNLNRYEKILTANHESRRKIRTNNCITSSFLIGQREKKKRPRKKSVKKEEKI